MCLSASALATPSHAGFFVADQVVPGIGRPVRFSGANGPLNGSRQQNTILLPFPVLRGRLSVGARSLAGLPGEGVSQHVTFTSAARRPSGCRFGQGFLDRLGDLAEQIDELDLRHVQCLDLEVRDDLGLKGFELIPLRVGDGHSGLGLLVELGERTLEVGHQTRGVHILRDGFLSVLISLNRRMLGDQMSPNFSASSINCCVSTGMSSSISCL